MLYDVMHAHFEAADRPAVLLEGVTKRFRMGTGQDLVAVNSVSSTILTGSMVALAGPSGSGKSTLLYLIGALDRPDEGRVVVDGREIAQLRGRRLADHRRRVGFVFQRFNLLPTLTAIDNVLAPVMPYRTDYDKEKRAVQLLAEMGLAGWEHSVPSRLSGGQQQRVAIARALIDRPALVLADEPTGNLDSRTGHEIIELLLGLRDSYGVTVVLATHDPAIAGRCDRIVKLLDGCVCDDIPVTDGVDVAALLGAPSTQP